MVRFIHTVALLCSLLHHDHHAVHAHSELDLVLAHVNHRRSIRRAR